MNSGPVTSLHTTLQSASGCVVVVGLFAVVEVDVGDQVVVVVAVVVDVASVVVVP